jgi:hypothetical protein
MTWTIEYSRNADRFIHAEGIQGEVKNQIQGFLRKLRGKSINVDVKKLYQPKQPK